jgi:hypothetical protein
MMQANAKQMKVAGVIAGIAVVKTPINAAVTFIQKASLNTLCALMREYLGNPARNIGPAIKAYINNATPIAMQASTAALGGLWSKYGRR